MVVDDEVDEVVVDDDLILIIVPMVTSRQAIMIILVSEVADEVDEHEQVEADDEREGVHEEMDDR